VTGVFLCGYSVVVMTVAMSMAVVLLLGRLIHFRGLGGVGLQRYTLGQSTMRLRRARYSGEVSLTDPRGHRAPDLRGSIDGDRAIE
jgi:hypothetical protein